MRLILVCGLLLWSSCSAVADSLDNTLKEGDLVPEFEAPTLNGEIWKSSDHAGKGYLVLYFYPADLTVGCTKQACAFRDHQNELQECGIRVVGISGDSVQNHQLFTRMHSLNFPLLSDEDGGIARKFGVPLREGATISRSVDGVDYTLTRGVTASRWTFIVGPDGRIVHRDTAVTAEEDCQNVLKTVRRLMADSE